MSAESKANHRLALKIATRSSLQSIGRSALIACMVALPVAGLAAIAVVYDSTNSTVDERVRTVLGESEAQLVVVSPPSATLVQDPQSLDYMDSQPRAADANLRDPADVLPTGTRIITLGSTSVTATTAAGSASFDVLEGESWDPSLAGRFDVISGRAPTSNREVMVTASLLPRLGAKVGDTVSFQAPAPAQMSIVGVLDDQTRTASSEAFFMRNGAITTPENGPWDVYYALPDLALSWDDVQELNAQGIVAISRDVLLHGPPAVNVQGGPPGDLGLLAIIAMVGVFAAFEVILLAGAAFTVTARQQQRALATIASVGAPRRLLFRILAANGIVLGAIGGVLGCIVGVAGAFGLMAATTDGSATQYYGYHVPWLALLGSVIFAVVIGWIASLVPARNASRFDIVAALRGARKPPAPSKRTPAIGLAMMIVGFALTVVGGILLAILIQAGRGIANGHPLLWLPIVMMIAGPILAQLGLVLCGPLLLRGISRVLSRRSIGARLASRDAARNPSRAVPALAAIMTTVFVAVVAMCLISAGQLNSEREHMWGAMLGQVAVNLRYIEPDGIATGTIDDPDAIVQALKSTLGSENIRVLSNVPDPYASEYKEDGTPIVAEDVIAVPMVPDANLCPTDTRSPDYNQAVADGNSEEYYELMTDPRCNENYLAMSGSTSGHLYVGDAQDLALVLGREPSDASIEALRSGGAVALYPQYVENGKFTITWWSGADAEQSMYTEPEGAPIRSVKIDAVVDKPVHSVSYGVFISPATADAIELDYSPAVVVADMAEPPTRDQTDALNEALSVLPGSSQGAMYAQIESGPPQYATVLAWALLALSALISIAASAVAIGLARFDGRQDDATLAALGASPRVRRSFAFWQAIIIAGFGTLVGAVIGLVPAFALSANPHMPFAPPWLQIAITVIGLPVVIAAGSWLLTRKAKVSARRMSMA